MKLKAENRKKVNYFPIFQGHVQFYKFNCDVKYNDQKYILKEGTKLKTYKGGETYHKYDFQL